MNTGSIVPERSPSNIPITKKITTKTEVEINGKRYRLTVQHRLGHDKTDTICNIVQNRLKTLQDKQVKAILGQKFKAKLDSTEQASAPLVRPMTSGSQKSSNITFRDWTTSRRTAGSADVIQAIFRDVFQLKMSGNISQKTNAAQPLAEGVISRSVARIASFVTSLLSRSETSHISIEDANATVQSLGLRTTLEKLPSTGMATQEEIAKRLTLSTQAEREIIAKLKKKFELTPEELKQVLNGAYVCLMDNGETYAEWLQIEGANERQSSHVSLGPQFAVRGHLVRELLFGINQNEKKEFFTWFQLERNPLTVLGFLPHMLDWVKYKVSGKNQGPYGSSRYTERGNQLIITPKANKPE